MRMPQIAIRTIIVSGSVAACSLALLTWFVGPWFTSARSPAPPNVYRNLKQLGLALLNYESTYGSLPPTYVADPHGTPLYSWRVVLMAFWRGRRGGTIATYPAIPVRRGLGQPG